MYVGAVPIKHICNLHRAALAAESNSEWVQCQEGVPLFDSYILLRLMNLQIYV